MYDKATLSKLSRFAGIEAGSTVLDVFPGSGDWTRLFSDLVGPEGRVYCFVPTEVAHFESDPVGQMTALAKEPGRQNVQVISDDVAAPPVGAQSLDIVWVHLFYHDLHTSLMQRRGATASRFNRAVFDRMKPGGRYVVVDHAAAAGTGADKAQSLHRIDPAAVRTEVEAAGFTLADQTDLLANARDPKDLKVFDPAIKGETDRFAYRFVRPTR